MALKSVPILRGYQASNNVLQACQDAVAAALD